MQIFAPLVLLAAAVVAVPTGSTGGSAPAGAQCCQNVKNSSQIDSVTKGLIFALLGINVSDLNIPIGTGCTPIAVLGGVSCNTNTVNCGTVAQAALIGLNCVPIIINV